MMKVTTMIRCRPKSAVTTDSLGSEGSRLLTSMKALRAMSDMVDCHEVGDVGSSSEQHDILKV